ncbi:hypothetical protein JCM8097_005172 [Rhodosporidiobolus ruineniae]
MAAPPRPATYGLATQLRTPPLDGSPFSPSTTDPSSVRSSPHKVTPAMRDDKSPRLFTMPQWGAKESPRTASSADGHGSPRSDGRGGLDEQTWQNVRGEAAGERGYPVPNKAKGLHARNHSSPQNGNPNRFQSNGLPSRPPRPDSPSRQKGTPTTAPLPPPVPRPTEVTATGAPIFNKVDFNFGQSQPLDLGIKLDPVYSTYKASKSTPNVSSPASKSDADESGTPYAAQVRVSVAQRVERAPSFRKASLAELNLDNMRRASQATTSSNRSSLVERTSGEGTLTAPQLRPPRAASPGGTARPIGQGMRSSYAGSTTSSQGGDGRAPPVVFRRASSVYIPNPSSAPPAALMAPSTSSGGGGIIPTPGQTPQAAITPGSKLPLNLLTLARRTAHISDVPGYAWRLNLLEKLELIMGSFLTVANAEAILSIGNGPEKRKSNRSESRKSQIGMPTSFNSPDSSSSKSSKRHSSKAPEPKTFFGRMKRALSNPGVHVPKETPPPLPTSKKAVFGVPLAQVAEYGFVTSMIAGQRHDLPGVTFSTVEEIYRRGQGTKVPGLMQLQGEPGRVAKLVQIYDSPPDYGEHHDLSIESIHNVTSLLKRYLRDLPEPVLDQRLWRLYLAACVDSQNPLKSRIACAQIILRLLPTPNFSLLVYLIAFLSQMPLFPENQLSLEAVSGIFGSSVMAPRPEMEKKPTKGAMVITGPTESFEAIGEVIKKGQEALLWLLNHWSSVADGLLEPDFDIDPSTVLDKHVPAPTLNVEVPPQSPVSLHIKQPAPPVPVQQQLQQPRQAPQPPPAIPVEPYQDVEDELRSWQPQGRNLSPPIEQRTLEISQAEQFSDVRQSYDSPTGSPQVETLQSPNLSLGGGASPVIRAGSRTSHRSHHRSPSIQHSQQLGTPRASGLATPKSPSSVYDVEDSGPPTPQKEVSQPFFSGAALLAQNGIRKLPLTQNALPQVPRRDEDDEDELEAEEVDEDEDEDEDEQDRPHGQLLLPPHDPLLIAPPEEDLSPTNRGSGAAASDSSPSFDNSEEHPRLDPPSEASSERSESVVTPRESQSMAGGQGMNGFRKSSVSEQTGEYRLSGGATHQVLDDMLDYDDNTSVYSFPSPPINLPTRPSPFLPPSPFLTQDEIDAALASEREKELEHLPPPVNPADYADYAIPASGVKGQPYQPQPPAGADVKPAPVLEEKLFTPKANGAADEQEEEDEQPSSTSTAKAGPSRDVEKLLATGPSALAAVGDSAFSSPATTSAATSFAGHDEEEEEQEGPPVPLKHSPYKPSHRHTASVPTTSSPRLASSTRSPRPASTASTAKALSPVLASEFEPKRASLPASDTPGAAPAALLRSKDDQLLEAQQAAEQHRKEVQALWKQLTDLELERADERKEMHGLRKEVEGFKERMTKRLSRGLNEQEKKKLDEAVRRASDAEEREKRRDEEHRKAKEDVELFRLEAQHARDEAARAHEEVGEVRGELRKVEELRRKEQDDARATIEALEAQLSSIRAVLLGGAGIKI